MSKFVEWATDQFGRIIPKGFAAWKLGNIGDGTEATDVATFGQVSRGVPTDLFIQNTVLPEDKTITVPEGYIADPYGPYHVGGTLIIEGTMFVRPLP